MKRLLLLFLLAWPGASAAQSVDVVMMRDNFIVASIAAQKCNAGDKQKQEAHERNFNIVSKKAMEVIMKRSPETDPEELRKQDLAHIERLQDSTFDLLRAEGCKSEKVRTLLRMHKLHENIRF
jgi:hypothetical protein